MVVSWKIFLQFSSLKLSNSWFFSLIIFGKWWFLVSFSSYLKKRFIHQWWWLKSNYSNSGHLVSGENWWSSISDVIRTSRRWKIIISTSIIHSLFFSIFSHKWIKLIKDPHVTDQYTALLAVGTARKYDEGKFTCQVEDFNIQQCKSKFVKVKRPPLVKIEPMSLTVRKVAG